MVRSDHGGSDPTLQENFGLSSQKAMYRENEIRRHFSEAWIDGYEDLISRDDQPPQGRSCSCRRGASRSESDRHLKHKDFPSSSLAPYAITAQGPSAFLKNLYDMAPSAVMETLETQAAAIGQSMPYLLSRLHINAPAFVEMIGQTLSATIKPK